MNKKQLTLEEALDLAKSIPLEEYQSSRYQESVFGGQIDVYRVFISKDGLHIFDDKRKTLYFTKRVRGTSVKGFEKIESLYSTIYSVKAPDPRIESTKRARGFIQELKNGS